MTDEILSVINGQVYGVWFLIGAALVFWMQAGFAMVEAGFTRAKNTGNIIMKNLSSSYIGRTTGFHFPDNNSSSCSSNCRMYDLYMD